MNDIEVSSIDLVEGGNVFKQGHYLTLGYVPRDEKGETVDLSGKTLNVSLWGRKGVVFEAAATYSGGVIRFTFDKLVAAGDYTVEFTATSSADAKYRKKFPTNQHSGRIAIKQSADDLGVVGIQVYTVAQLKAEQKAIQTQYETTLNAKVQATDAKSTTALTKSVNAEAAAQDVKNQFEQVVISGDSSVEAAAARVAPDQTFVSLKARLDAKEQAAAAKLAKTETEMKKNDSELRTKIYSASTKKARKPMISVVFDDAFVTDYTILKPIADTLNIPVGIAYITGETNGANKSGLSYERAMELQNNGWEIMLHTVSSSDLRAHSLDELDRQYYQNKMELLERGFKVESMVYPLGLNDEKVRAATRKHCRAGFGTRPGTNTIPLDTQNIRRVHMPDYSLADIKGRIDTIGNGWLVLYGHTDSVNFTLAEQQKFKDAILYAQSKNIEIATPSKALDHFENTIEVINDGSGESFIVGADGVPYSRKLDEQNHVFKPATYYDTTGSLIKIDATNPVSFYEKRKVTSTSFGGGHQSGITLGSTANMGGTLFTYRLNDDDVLNYQMFVPYNNVGSAIRYWTVNGWGVWRQAVLKSEMGSSHRFNPNPNAFPATAVHADFESGTTVWDVSSAGSTGFPATAGTVTMHRSGQGHPWSYQLFDQYQSANRYKRWMTSETTWSAWAKVAQAIV